MRYLRTARGTGARYEGLRPALDLAPGERGLLVAPSRDAGEQLWLSLGLGHVHGLSRVTWRGLQLSLAQPVLAREGQIPLRELAAEALAARALARAGQSGGLGALRDAPGLPRALARTLAELRAVEVSTARLAQGGPRSRELGELLEAYVRSLDKGGLADLAKIRRAALQRLETSGWEVDRLILLDCAPRNPGDARLLTQLAQRATQTWAVLSPDHPERESWAESLKGEPEPIPTPFPSCALERARAQVFAPGPLAAGEDDPSLVVFSSSSETAEARDVARRILAHAEGGVPFDRMAVLLREPERYGDRLEDAFRRAQIPACFTRSTRRPSPAGRALLALLACAREGLSADRFAEYLSFGEVPDPDPETPTKAAVPWVAARPDDRQLVFFSLEPEPDGIPAPTLPVDEPEEVPVIDGRLQAPFRWERLLVDASVVGGKDRWRRRLRGLRAELEERHDALLKQGDEGAGRVRLDLRALRHLESFALPLIDALAELPGAAPWTTWRSALEALAVRSLRAPAPVLRVLAELRGFESPVSVSLVEVQLVLHEQLAFLRDDFEAPVNAETAEVWVGSVDEAAGRSFEVVFLPGLAEKGFPKRADEDPLLPDEERLDLEPNLTTRARKAADERMRLRTALDVAEMTLEASWPRLDPERGRPRVPSFYALDLVRAARGALPRIDLLEREAAARWEERPGWSVPADPLDAIDATEFDLAVLAESLSGAAPLDGAGRYLVDGASTPHPHLVRAIRARAARWRASYGPNDGLVASPTEDASTEALVRYRLGARPYSPTGLEHYAKCPYRFFLASVLRLRPREDVERLEQLDPILKGNIAHSSLFRWFQRIRDDDLLPFEAEDEARLLEHLEVALDETRADYEERLAPALPEVWRREVEDLARDLRGWVRNELQDPSGFSPVHAELAFGLASRGESDEASRTEPVRILERFLVRGSIDLVERRDRDGYLRITDYKTGRRPAEGYRSESLQPMIYALAAETLVGAEVESSRLAYCTERERFSSDYTVPGPRARKRLSRILEHIDAQLGEGWLPAAPRKGACKFCDYRPICGTDEERRNTRKTPDAKASLPTEEDSA